MATGLVPAFKYASVAATVLKWFTGIASPTALNIQYLAVLVSTTEATDTLIFSDEDGTNVFAVVPLDAAGLFEFTFPEGIINMPVGKDIKVAHSGTSGVAKVTIGVGKWV